MLITSLFAHKIKNRCLYNTQDNGTIKRQQQFLQQ
jgi:hypothetical protein